jgi:CDP-diglyceride synthetase
LVILIPLISLGIIFFNAFFQDGSMESGAPSGLKLLLRIYRVILFFLVLIMTYKIFRTYSLDINVVICIITVILFSLTYAVTACFSEHQEQKWIRLGNISSALFFIIVLFLLNLPYMQIAFNLGAPSSPITVTLP